MTANNMHTIDFVLTIDFELFKGFNLLLLITRNRGDIVEALCVLLMSPSWTLVLLLLGGCFNEFDIPLFICCTLTDSTRGFISVA